MLKNISKIAIIGGPGTGKSTLAKNIGKELDLPVYHIDGIHHLDNWKQRDPEERDEIILEKVSEPKWVFDGTYKSTLEIRVQKSDVTIFLNYSTIARLRGVFLRYLKTKGTEIPEIPGCKEKMSIEFIKVTINWNKTKGATIKEILNRNKNKRILIFKNRKQLNRWYKQ